MDCDGRYLLFLDILGFSELVQKASADKVYEVIKNALNPFLSWEEDYEHFNTIYFSDTFLFYQASKGYNSQVFSEIYNISSMLLSELLAMGIPARGSLVYGQFEVETNSQSPHQIYFGKALIEAYKAQQAEQWIGITIQPSAWKPFEQANPGYIDLLEQVQLWKIRKNDIAAQPSASQSQKKAEAQGIDSLEQGNPSGKINNKILLLNPFLALLDWYQAEQQGETDNPPPIDEPEFTDCVLGFRYIVKEASKYADNGEFSTRDAVKYHATVAFLRKIMGDDMFEWAKDVATLFESDGKPESK